MKRKDMVSKLMTEGFTEKTLAGMTDKQLALLTGKIIPEQITTPGKVLVPQSSPTAQKDIATAKLQKKTIETYESKEVDEEISNPKLGADTKSKSTDDKEAVIKRLKYKIKHEKDKKKVADAKKLLAKMTEKKEEMSEEKFKSKTEWLKSKGIIKDDDKKETTAKDGDETETTESSDTSSNEKAPTTKAEGGSEYKKRLSKNNMGLSLKEWVGGIVGKKVHPFTSKNEIMEMIDAKLAEQRPQEAPRPAEPDIETKPGKKEAPGVDPDDPFRDPHPGIDPNPKAKKKISAEDAKNKIIDLLKKEL